MIENIGCFDPALLTGNVHESSMADRIIEHVAEHFNVPVWKLLGKQRGQHIAFIRQVAMYLLRECTDLSYPMIAKLLGKNHSTCIHGYEVIRGRMIDNPEFVARIERLKEELAA